MYSQLAKLITFLSSSHAFFFVCYDLMGGPRGSSYYAAGTCLLGIWRVLIFIMQRTLKMKRSGRVFLPCVRSWSFWGLKGADFYHAKDPENEKVLTGFSTMRPELIFLGSEGCWFLPCNRPWKWKGPDEFFYHASGVNLSRGIWHTLFLKEKILFQLVSYSLFFEYILYFSQVVLL